MKQLNENLNGLTNSNIETVGSSTSSDNNSLELKLDAKLSGVSFTYVFKLVGLDTSYIKDHVVLPLMFSSFEFQARENDLIKAINSKDKELDDYKSQGAKLTRSKLSNTFSVTFSVKYVLFFFN